MPETTTTIEAPAATTSATADAKPESLYLDEEPAPLPEPPAEKKAEAEPKPAAEETPETKEMPAYLLDRARELGVSEEEVRTYSEPEQLDRFLTALDRHIGMFAQRVAGTRRETPPVTQAQDVRQSQPAATSRFELPVEKLSETFDPELVKVIQAMNDHYAGKVEQLEGVLANALANSQQSSIRAQEIMFDGMVNDLGEDYKEVFGSGDGLELMRSNRSAHANRKKLWDELEILRAGYTATGRTPPGEKALFERALNSAFGETVTKVRGKKTQEQVRNRQGQFVAKPGNRDGTPAASPRERAIQAARAFMREHGMDSDT